MKFSIVTPVYNSGELMVKYFDSLENQTYKNFEMVIVDDNSADNSLELIEKYKEESGLDITICKNTNNIGPGLSRNKGLNFSTGEYVLFLDSDDYLETNSLEKIFFHIEKYNTDCIVFDYYRENNNNKKYGSSIPGFDTGEIKKTDAIANITGSVSCKVYKKSILNKHNIIFPPILRFEDMVFNKRALSFCDTIFYFKSPLYNYVNNEKSIVNNKENRNETFAISAFKIVKNEISQKFPIEVEAIYVREVLYSTVLVLVENKIKKNKIISYIKKTEKEYPQWYKNKYIKNFNKHQRIVLKMIRFRSILSLKSIVFLKKIL